MLSLLGCCSGRPQEFENEELFPLDGITNLMDMSLSKVQE